MNKVKSLFKARWMSSLIFLLLLFLVTGIAEPDFLSYSNIISCFNTATMYTLLAIGIAFVIMTGEIDVSIGSTLGLSAAMTGLIAKQDGSIAVMLLAVVATGAVIGLIQGILFLFVAVTVVQLVTASASADAALSAKDVEDSILVGFVADHNPITSALESVMKSLPDTLVSK